MDTPLISRKKKMPQKGALKAALAKAAATIPAEDLALGWLRYETLRKINPREFSALWEKNIRTGIPFDDLLAEKLP